MNRIIMSTVVTTSRAFPAYHRFLLLFKLHMQVCGGERSRMTKRPWKGSSQLDDRLHMYA